MIILTLSDSTSVVAILQLISQAVEMFYDSVELHTVRFWYAASWMLCRDNWWLLVFFRQPPIIGDEVKTRVRFGEA